MKKVSIIFLQGVIVLAGLGSLLLLLWEPHLEGRNAHATTFQIYFNDPFLAYIYTAFVSFFVALYQAFRLLGHLRRGNIFSSESVRALRVIKYCALLFGAFIVGAEVYIVLLQSGTEDIAGGVAMGLFLLFGAAVAAAVAALFEKTLQSAVDLRSENDLTV